MCDNTPFEVCLCKLLFEEQVSLYISTYCSISTRIGKPDPKAGTCKMDECDQVVWAWGEKELSSDI